MRVLKTCNSREVCMGRLPHGADLLAALTEVCAERDVRAGRIEALGAVHRARIACYDQEAREYLHIDLDHPLEITNLIGNISLKEGRPFLHAHVTLADKEGRTWGGHLAPGTEVFACEFVIETFDGAALERQPDPATGLPLWTGPGAEGDG